MRGAKFEATYSFTDQDGNRRRRSSTFDTKTHARRWLTERQADISGRDGVVDITGEDLTTSEFLLSWLEGHCSADPEPSGADGEKAPPVCEGMSGKSGA